VREILTDIVAASLRAGAVIKRIRTLTKRGETRYVPMQVNDVVRDVLSLIRSDLIARGVTVHTELEEPLPQVLADPVQVQQVLINLITNACDAMAENPDLDRILTLKTQRDNWLVRVTVQDRGCGLPHGDSKDIFRSFFTTKPNGLGLGLSICATILADHHGRIWAEPNATRGTRFCFELTATEPHTP
jgi:two-component system sensor kinase FixL